MENDKSKFKNVKIVGIPLKELIKVASITVSSTMVLSGKK